MRLESMASADAGQQAGGFFFPSGVRLEIVMFASTYLCQPSRSRRFGTPQGSILGRPPARQMREPAKDFE
jgi:hypothetical protein